MKDKAQVPGMLTGVGIIYGTHFQVINRPVATTSGSCSSLNPKLFHSLLDNDFCSSDDVHTALWGAKALALQVVDGGRR